MDMAIAARKVGILGGSFNPVHVGHLILAETAAEALELDRVVLIPCARRAHKASTLLASEEHRLAMLRLATAENSRMEVSDMELVRGGVSYTVDTIAEYRERNPMDDVFFIVGADSLLELHMWKDIYGLLRLCKMVPVTRSGIRLRPGDIHLDAPWPERIEKAIIRGREIEVSSSDIRHRVAEDMSIRYLVPSAVEHYIAEQRLYVR